MLKQEQQLKLQQKLSPAQIQVIRMLELPTLEFEERVMQELEENPVLEEGADVEENTLDTYENDNEQEERNELDNEDFNLDDYISDDEVPEYRLHANNASKDDKQDDIPFSSGMTFHEHLISQLGLQNLNQQLPNLS